jgi:hypothetical protein
MIKGKRIVKVGPEVTDDQSNLYSICWHTFSSVDGDSTADVDVILVDATTQKIKNNLYTCVDGKTKRQYNNKSPEEYISFIGSGEWITFITSEDDPQMLEYCDWLDWEAEEK